MIKQKMTTEQAFNAAIIGYFRNGMQIEEISMFINLPWSEVEKVIIKHLEK
jgi:hypothetical protein